MPKQKGFSLILIIIVITLVLSASAGGYYFLVLNSKIPAQEVSPQPTSSPSGSIQIKEPTTEEKLQNAKKILKTRDWIALLSSEFYQLNPDGEEIGNMMPLKSLSSTVANLTAKNFKLTVDTQHILGNSPTIRYTDIDVIHINDQKKTYFQSTIDGNTDEFWIVIDENNPPKEFTPTRTDPVAALIEDSVDIYVVNTLSPLKEEQPPYTDKKVQVTEAKIDPQKLAESFNRSYGSQGKYIFDFSEADPKVKFSLDGTRLREVAIVFKNATVKDSSSRSLGSFSGGRIEDISYVDEDPEIKKTEIKAPEGKTIPVEEFLKTRP